jgi:oligoribonuclease
VNPVIAWIDVETTGLNPQGAKLLEVACLVTDTEFNLLDEHGYHAILQYDAREVDSMIAQADRYVVEMHHKTDLWAQLPYGKPHEVVEAELLSYIRQYAPEARQALVGGNSITLDRNFLEVYLPDVYNHLYYRSIDVSTLALLAQWRYGEGVKYKKTYQHAALADIRESIAEAKFLTELVMKPEL